MNWRATIAAGLIFIALLAFVWVESSYRVAEEGEVFRQSFLGLDLYGIDAEQVTHVRIERAEEDDIVLEKRGEDWYLVEPFPGLADSEEVMRIVRAVAELRPTTSREGVDLTEEHYGLTDASLVATITYNGGRTAQLKLGAEAASGTERYASASGSDRLYIVGASTRTTLWKDPRELREKDVANVETDEVQKVTLDHGDEHVVAVRSDTEDDRKWRLTAPLDTAADEWNVRQLISNVGDLRAEGFLSPEEAEGAETGFKEPQAKISLQMAEGEPLTITFGNTETREIDDLATEEEIIYVRTSRRDEVLLVKADALANVQKTAFDLRDKSIVSFERDEVTRVRVERTEGLSFTIARRPDGWFVEKPQKAEARQGAVDDVLWNLEDVSATEFVTEDAGEQELRDYGLAVPQTVVTIELRHQDDPIEILIGDETEQGWFYARTADSERVVLIDEFLMGDLPENMGELEQAPTAPEDDAGAATDEASAEQAPQPDN
ncbi:MAG: DUF4340 domain-containing protein [Armatimonadota bacterium]